MRLVTIVKSCLPVRKLCLILAGLISASIVPAISSAESLELIAANPLAGFHWPYYLYIPSQVTNPHMLVVSNNSPSASDDFADHIAAANFYYSIKKTWADALHSAFIVPVWPRPTGLYDGTIAIQTLGRGGFEDGAPAEYARADLQLIAMIEDARNRLSTQNISTSGKIYIWGGSSSANFANRFIALHPERIRAAALLGHGWTLLPTTHYAGNEMHYPYGLGGVEQFLGKPFNLALFKNIPQHIAMGADDKNGWGLHWYVGYTFPYWEFYEWFDSQFEWTARRFMQVAEDSYASIDSIAQFVLYEGIGHTETVQMSNNVLAFFQNAPPIVIIGDINGNEGLDLADVILSLQVTAGIQTGALQRAASVHAEDKIGLSDAVYILNQLAQP